MRTKRSDLLRKNGFFFFSWASLGQDILTFENDNHSGPCDRAKLSRNSFTSYKG